LPLGKQVLTQNVRVWFPYHEIGPGAKVVFAKKDLHVTLVRTGGPVMKK